MAIIDGGPWWAAVEGVVGSTAPREDHATLRYCKVVLWERINDANREAQHVAWLNGWPPVRADNFNEATGGSYIVNHFVHQLPEGARTFVWA